ncbi:Endonuclease/exonuclease/phosphatase [Trinorchestia longiramus]|nr:Endonuclease/exonuclease/phosphatase [Trinorchestia longiramus]
MTKHYEDVSSFLSVTEVRAWKVKCCLPVNQSTSVGAIRPLREDTSSEELTESLIDSGFEGHFIRKKRQRRGTSSVSSSGGDSDAWDSIDSSTESITPSPSQPLSPSQVLISDGLCPQNGDTGELLDDQQLSLSSISAIEINPNKNLNLELLRAYVNAHNPLWVPAKLPNTTGRNLEQILQNNPSLALITPPSLPTYFNVYQNSFSTLDLTFLSAVLQPIASISTQDLGSDHYPIVTCIGVEPSSVRYKSRPSWRFGSGKWANWSAALQQPEMPEILDVEQGFNEFRKNLISASITTFEQTKEYRSPRYNKTWWSPRSADAVEAKRQAKRTLIAQPSNTNLMEFKRFQARQRK